MGSPINPAVKDQVVKDAINRVNFISESMIRERRSFVYILLADGTYMNTLLSWIHLREVAKYADAALTREQIMRSELEHVIDMISALQKDLTKLENQTAWQLFKAAWKRAWER